MHTGYCIPLGLKNQALQTSRQTVYKMSHLLNFINTFRSSLIQSGEKCTWNSKYQELLCGILAYLLFVAVQLIHLLHIIYVHILEIEYSTCDHSGPAFLVFTVSKLTWRLILEMIWINIIMLSPFFVKRVGRINFSIKIL